MRVNIFLAVVVAAALLAGTCPGIALGGWFGLGGSDKPADASKSVKATGYTADKKPVDSSSTAKPGSKSLFGLPGGTSTKSDSKKKYGMYAAKPPKDEKNKSWWNSWAKPKDPPKPKTTTDWMKLKQVQY